MPELPELSVISQNLKKRILNKKIESVVIGNPYKIQTPEAFKKTLTETSISDIIREGKELHFLLANNSSFGVHLMLNGNYTVCGKDEVEDIKSKVIALIFEDKEAFAVADVQRLCRVTLNPKIAKTPDALSDKFTIDYFLSVAKKSLYRNIKSVLTDQSVVRGIGNAYADEILYKADISPESIMGKIPEEKIKELYEAIPSVLNWAIENIMKISPDLISGEERSFLKVHNSSKKITDDGEKIIKKTVDKKSAYFTERQKRYF